MTPLTSLLTSAMCSQVTALLVATESKKSKSLSQLSWLKLTEPQLQDSGWPQPIASLVMGFVGSTF